MRTLLCFGLRVHLIGGNCSFFLSTYLTMSQRLRLIWRAVRANDDSQATTFEQELRDRVNLSPALEASVAPSATDTAPKSDATDDGFNAWFKDTFKGIN